MAVGLDWFIVGWTSLHLMAFACACGTRVAAGSRIEGVAHLSFYIALAAVGMALLVGRQIDMGWIWSAITFMAMVITAVVDFRHVGEPAHARVHG